MLLAIAIILASMWVLGLLTASGAGGFIHILLLLAFITIVIRVVQGRRVA